MQNFSEAIERYALEHSLPENGLLKKLAAETRAKTDVSGMMIGPIEGALLRLLVRVIRAKRVLEIGTFTGYSALTMAQAMPAGGKLVTCDINEEYSQIARRYWAKSPHGKKIVPEIGPALETLKTLKGPFDLVFIDADKHNYLRYWEKCVPLVRPGGVLVADNVLWSGRVLKPMDTSDKVLARFAKRVNTDKRVECALLTVRDGVMLAWKK